MSITGGVVPAPNELEKKVWRRNRWSSLWRIFHAFVKPPRVTPARVTSASACKRRHGGANVNKDTYRTELMLDKPL
jgi:hypothetical protein